jgi:hypothetical protein
MDDIRAVMEAAGSERAILKRSRGPVVGVSD